jgi:hypothetical protein
MSRTEKHAWVTIRELMRMITAAPSLGVGAEVVGAAQEAERIAAAQLDGEDEAEAHAA